MTTSFKNGRTVSVNSAESSDKSISVYFRDIAQELIKKIESYPIVVGCVAWLTHPEILSALATRERVSIVIQKEDFLRPDTGSWTGKKLRLMYSQLPPGAMSNAYSDDWGQLVRKLNCASPWTAEPVRWVGNFNDEKQPAFPRMHNKFLVFCDSETVSVEYAGDDFSTFSVKPRAVWTGSFNCTDNATKSLENALYLTDTEIVESYYNEWQSIFGLSESIPNEYWDAKYEWEAPEYLRVGT